VLRARGLSELPPESAHTVTVPGACAGWCDLLERHGSLPRATVLAPAIRLAEEGFPVGEITAHFWDVGLSRHPEATNIGELSIDGRAPRAGERFRNPGLARALLAVADAGKDPLYCGDVSAATVREFASPGALCSLEVLTSAW